MTHDIIPRRHHFVFFFTLFYIVAFSLGFLIGGNYEFVIYTAVMLGVLLVVTLLVREYDIPDPLLWTFSFAGILHMLGGGVHVNGDRLYGFILYPVYISSTDPGFQIFRYDQLVHLFGYGVIALCIHYALRRYTPQSDPVLRACITILATMGIGSFNEVAEFFATLTLPSTGVGDYSNTLLDLTSNMLGAIVAVSGYETWIRLKKGRQ
ncbi:MAG TPA: DUF2238 domain-containing protein [Candidatus Paceibacterota bacterium]|nr:DUF2238 domain-containing protein [Candidatus Paceibacterota bacterium]